MPTENRRVAAYLPPQIDERLETFKSERGLKGDSPALIEILSEFFGVSREATHLSSSELQGLSVQVEDLSLKVAQLENELLGNLKNSPIGDLKNELLSELQGELFDRLKPDLRSELLGELKEELLRITFTLRSELREELLGELLDTLSKVPISPDRPDFVSSGEPPGELSKPDLSNVLQSSDQLLLTSIQQVEQKASTHSEPSSKSISELKPLAARELSRRLGFHDQVVTNNKNNWKNKPGKFAQWSKKSDPDGVAWEFNPDTKLFYPLSYQSRDSHDAEDF